MLMQALVFLAAYFLGAIPFPYLLARLKTGRDIREMGSGNVGATNVMRTSGKALGLLTLILDTAKGSVAVLGAQAILQQEVYGAVAGFCAMLGHAYPVFLNFRGGKSVATGGGSFLVLSPFGILTSIAVFVVMVKISRIVSMSSIIASALFPLFAWFYGAGTGVVLWGGLSAALIVFRHKTNIQRLMEGTEKKIGEPKDV